MMSRWASRAAIGTTVLVMLSACSGNGSSGTEGNLQQGIDESAYNNEPVTLTFYNHNAGILSQADLDALLAPVKAKYPNITAQFVADTTLDKMITAEQLPDVILTSNYYLHDLLQQNIGIDLSGMIKQHNVDLGKLEPEAVNLLKKFGSGGEIYGIPYAMNYGVMVYNKDLFDRFAVPYPKDNMTWDEVIELARQVTKSEQGMQYVGLSIGDPQVMSRAYSLPVVDDTQTKAVLTSDPYKKIFGMYERLYGIPGIVDANKKYNYGIDDFLKEQKVAMYPYWIANLTTRLPQLQEAGKNFNWDVVSFPSYSDKPGLGREIDFHMAMITPTSKNKEAAFAAIQTLITEESQRAMNKGIRLTILNDPELKKQFSSDTKLYEGKNLAGIFSVKPAPLPAATQYDTKMYSFLKEAVKSMVTESKDVNTVLREAEEKGNNHILEVSKQ